MRIPVLAFVLLACSTVTAQPVPPIVPAVLGERAGAIGAALLARDTLGQPDADPAPQAAAAHLT